MQSVALVLPDSRIEEAHALAPHNGRIAGRLSQTLYRSGASEADQARAVTIARDALRSEEHTSELQSLMRISYAVFCLKKKNKSKPLISHLLLTTQKKIIKTERSHTMSYRKQGSYTKRTKEAK